MNKNRITHECHQFRYHQTNKMKIKKKNIKVKRNTQQNVIIIFLAVNGNVTNCNQYIRCNILKEKLMCPCISHGITLFSLMAVADTSPTSEY